ncbi:TATA box-binding protein-associated factor RNA polymerase I subunit C [Clupea harengus]|uniref:TATA box-binding protein-associated factor RNA polymerase I subunit C n=1 Tax=Clupea harengus TaxID=7950 RepID=A0A8M1KMW4_CLUHA|nr:TATA box-binding protein-associated factor RNA polymerase I subunit C [Clupea harengus]XP_042565401.1 TATA box-binding protein-associated factor RNA polymerase I subunit C [Clupea harengus]
MDNEFPSPLFSSFFNDGPPDQKRAGNIGGWRSYNHVLGHEHHSQSVQWQAQNQVMGERWLSTQPIVVPLLPPSRADIYSFDPHTKTNPMDFPKHMQNFYLGHSTHAFQTMSHLLSESFDPGEKHSRQMSDFRQWRRPFLRELKYTACPVTSTQKRTQCYDNVFEDALHDIPPALLAELLHEELGLQRQHEQFPEVSTGGALGCVPFSESNDPQEGCLIFPSNPGFQTLNFHKVELKSSRTASLKLKGQPITFDLNGPIRQVSIGTPQDAVYVGVRSDHFCGAWLVGDSVKPRALGVIQMNQPATCLVVSPHVSKELLVANESGAVYLWTVGKGLTKVREEDSNLYFNAKSTWRWCEFSAHPRVMIYTDRTGAELTDFRTGEDHSYTLFRIGKVSESKRGERVILSQYLSEVHAHHHLITTQYSAYIMDERMPSVPMLKWEHYMESPPMFAHVLAGTSPERSNRVLLGSQKAQELMMLQYSGGRDHACVAQGPHQKLLCPSDTMAHLPVRLPHRNQAVKERLSLPAAGLAAIQSSQHLCVLQLSTAGDLFYQSLRLCSEGLAEDSSQSSTSSEREEEEEEDVDGSQPPACSDSQPSMGRRSPGGLEVVVSDNPEHPPTSDTESGSGQELPQSLGLSIQSAGIATSLPGTRLQPNKKVLRKWNAWLSSLESKMAPNAPFSHCMKLTRDLDVSVELQRDPFMEHNIQGVQQDLRGSMSRGEVLVHSATHLPPLTAPPVPGVIEASEWTDDTSQRLTEAWQGRWRQWWEDKLGLNREQKREALRRKRRQEKKAKAHRRVALSGSFTSSVSNQTDSEYSGWSSQDLGSDWDEGVPSRPGSNCGALSPEIPITPNRSSVKPLFQSTQSSEQDANVPRISTASKQDSVPVDSIKSPPHFLTTDSSRASPHKKLRRTEQDLLESLFSSQEPNQALSEESSFPVMTQSSQRPPLIRASLSQASKPKKKAARMGF